MIRRLEQATGSPGSVLIQPYETEQGDCHAFDGKRTIERQLAVQ
jgi:hypothetical protein